MVLFWKGHTGSYKYHNVQYVVLRESLWCPPLQEKEGTRKWKLLKNKTNIGEDVIGQYSVGMLLVTFILTFVTFIIP
jgi:hypothetical protein